VLIIPREHHKDALALAADAPGLLADFIRAAGQVASQGGEGVDSLVQHTRATARDCTS
jgi:histidine triad (HIT) family protein